MQQHQTDHAPTSLSAPFQRATGRDFTLDRVVRMTALAADCDYATLALVREGQPLVAAAHGGAVASIDPEHALFARVVEANETVIWALSQDSIEDQSGPRPPLAQACAGEPVIAATGAVIGVLCLYSSRNIKLDSPVVRRALVDGVRLVEDALLMRDRAIRDPSTDLFTRRLFEEQFVSEWDNNLRARLPLSLMLIAVDHFESVTEAAGADATGALLEELARVISARTRRAGDTSYHFGGGQIAVALRGMQDDKAQSHAQAIREAVESLDLENHGLSAVTVSIGLTAIEDEAQIDDLSVHKLVAVVEAALAQAQGRGGNQVHVQLPPSRRLPGAHVSA